MITISKSSLGAKLVALYIMSLPLSFLDAGSIGSVSKAIAFLPLVYYALVNFRSLRYFDCASYETKALLVFLLLSFMSIIYSISTESSVSRCVSLFFNVVFIYLVSQNSFNRADKKIIAYSVLICSFVTSMLMLIYGYVGVDTFGRKIISVNGVEQDPNEMCQYLLIGIILNFYSLLKGVKKILNIFLLVVSMATVLMSGSRGGLLTVVMCLGMIFVITLFRREEISVAKKIGMVILVIVLLIAFSYTYTSWLPSDLQQRLTYASIVADGGSHRSTIWANLFSNYKNFNFGRQIFGSGTATVTVISGGYVAHNIYLETLVEMGAVGLLTLLILYFTYIKSAWKSNNIVLFISMIGFCMTGMTISTYRLKPLFLAYMLILIYKDNDSMEDGMLNALKSNNTVIND